jgi:hypothetical protein
MSVKGGFSNSVSLVALMVGLVLPTVGIGSVAYGMQRNAAEFMEPDQWMLLCHLLYRQHPTLQHAPNPVPGGGGFEPSGGNGAAGNSGGPSGFGTGRNPAAAHGNQGQSSASSYVYRGRGAMDQLNYLVRLETYVHRPCSAVFSSFTSIFRGTQLPRACS